MVETKKNTHRTSMRNGEIGWRTKKKERRKKRKSCKEKAQKRGRGGGETALTPPSTSQHIPKLQTPGEEDR